MDLGRTGDPLAVQITGREIYDEMVRVRMMLERLVDQATSMRDTVDSHDEQLRGLAQVPGQVADHEARLRTLEAAQPVPRLNDHSARIRALEANRWPLPSAALLIALGSLVVGVITLLD